MTFGEEVTQLLLIIGALLLALAGINFWTKKGGSITLPSLSGKPAKPADGTPTNSGEEADEFLDNMGLGKSSGGSGGSGGSGADRHGDRFQLTGKDAEAAARVLKRMLKQGGKSKDPKGH